MKKHSQPFLLTVLVVASLPTLQGARRTLLDITPALSPYGGATTPTPYGGGAAPGSFPSPKLAPTSPPQHLSPLHAPPPPSGGGSGGVVVPDDSGGRSSRLSGGQKAGILVGVVVGAALIGSATMVYMKRRRNIQRARFSVLARRSQL